MPVARRKSIYGENPELSQLGATGQLYIPSTVKSLIGKNLAFPLLLNSFAEGSPHLGYNWEIINLYFPVSLNYESGSAGAPKKLEISVSIKAGSYVLFHLNRYIPEMKAYPFFEKPGTLAYENLLFGEAPPVPVSIPGGQGISVEVTLRGEFVEGEGSSSLVMRLGNENEFSGTSKGNIIRTNKPSPALITYRFV